MNVWVYWYDDKVMCRLHDPQNDFYEDLQPTSHKL